MKEIRIKTKERTEFRILIVNRAKPQNQNPQKNWTENGIFWTKILSWFRKCRKWKCKTIYETVCKWNNLMWKRKKKHLIELKITLLVKRKKKNNRIFIIRDTQITCTHRDTNAPHPISTCRQRNFPPPMFSCQFYHFFQFISMNGYRTLSVININRISFHSHHIDPSWFRKWYGGQRCVELLLTLMPTPSPAHSITLRSPLFYLYLLHIQVDIYSGFGILI